MSGQPNSQSTSSFVVVKIGGAAGLDLDALCQDIAARWHAGERIVLVHGGSDATNTLAEQLGHPPRMVTSPSGHASRYTDRRTLEIFAMATAGLNRSLVEQLQGLGVPAWGISGVDGRLLRARRKAAIRIVEDGKVRILRDDWTGTSNAADGAMLGMLLGAGYLPVIAPIAAGENGEMLNVDGDRAAAVVAGALGADDAGAAVECSRPDAALPRSGIAGRTDRGRRPADRDGVGAGPHEEEAAGRAGSPRAWRRARGPRRWPTSATVDRRAAAALERRSRRWLSPQQRTEL